jgi:hypothetical protein
MAEGLSTHEHLVPSGGDHAAPAAASPAASVRPDRSATRRAGSPHSRKFMFATAALVGIALGALTIAVLVLLSSSGTASSSPPWSAWKPPDTGLAGEREIAGEVAPFYRASPASQLAVVTVQNVAAATSGSPSGTELAVRDPKTGTVAAISGNSAVYNLCGLGPGCTVTPARPSAARLLLLRREALELALYSFRYIGGVNNVVVILPPGRTTTTCTGLCATPHGSPTTKSVDLAVVFQRQGLEHFTSRPLAQTLPEQLPPPIQDMQSAPEAELVSVITAQALFQQQLITAQDGTNVLVLSPVPPQ